MGTLYDLIVTDGEINVQDRDNSGSGHGWSGVNQVFWNCRGAASICQSPWTSGKNFNIGFQGAKKSGQWQPNRPDGVWEGQNVKGLFPESLYEAQMTDRSGSQRFFSVYHTLEQVNDSTFVLSFNMDADPNEMVNNSLYSITGTAKAAEKQWEISIYDSRKAIFTFKNLGVIPFASTIIIDASGIKSSQGNPITGLKQALFSEPDKRPVFTAQYQETNNARDSYAVAQSTKTGKLYLVKMGIPADGIIAGNFKYASVKYRALLGELPFDSLNPRTAFPDGKVEVIHSGVWTSGFFPGSLWYIFEYTGDSFWRITAEKYTANIEDQKYNGKTHDMGFKMFCSFGNGFRITGNEYYREVLLESARTLITRYNPSVGCIRSWDHNNDKWNFPVIIDNLMNLELLFWASTIKGDSIFYQIAVSHAEKTLENGFRDDNSSYHVVDYDPVTGDVTRKNTHQGYSHESAWARGQAWGLYGYTMLYRETGNLAFLEQAHKIAGFILHHKNLPEDLIPYWDFDAPDIPETPRDASAAAIICSALYELGTFDADKGKHYFDYADQILVSLSSEPYLSQYSNNNFLIQKCVGNLPAGSEIDAPLIYADYYFLEANLRHKKLKDLRLRITED
jgi:unsaturated chondroitin disaccharide hydrolase